MLVGILDGHIDNVTRHQIGVNIAKEDIAVDLWRVGLRSAGGADAAVFIGLAHFVDDNGQGAANFCAEFCRADCRGFFHDPLVAFLFHFFGDMIGQGVGRCAFDGLKAECANPVQLCLVQPIEQILKIRLAFAGKTDDKAAAHRDIGCDSAPVF